MKIPEGVVREVLGASDRGYYLPEGTPKELEMRIGWAKIGSGEVVEEEVLNGIFTVPYPHVRAQVVVARPQLKKETLEATDVVGFGYESDAEKVRLRSSVRSWKRVRLGSQWKVIIQLRRDGRRRKLSTK